MNCYHWLIPSVTGVALLITPWNSHFGAQAVSPDLASVSATDQFCNQVFTRNPTFRDDFIPGHFKCAEMATQQRVPRGDNVESERLL